MRNTRTWGLLLPLLIAVGAPAFAGDDPLRPGWLVGTWEIRQADGTGFIALRPDGTVEFGVATTDGERGGGEGGSWEVRDGSLVVTDGGEPATFRIERLPDEQGALRARFVQPGGEKDAVVARKAADLKPGRPRWLMGTWVAEGKSGSLRMVLYADGRARLTRDQDAKIEEHDMGLWKEEAGRLRMDGESTPLEMELLPPEGERLRARFLDGKPAAAHLRWTRASWLPPQQTYEGPLIGRWDVVGATLPTAWRFGPYSRYERRRKAGTGVMVENGRFQVARGATGDVLQLETDAGRTLRLDLRVDGPRLRMTDPTRGSVVEAVRAEGSAPRVAAAFVDEAVERADVEASWLWLHGSRHRLAAPAAPGNPPTGPIPPKEPDPEAPNDPAPGDVYVGMEAFRTSGNHRFESEDVLVLDRTSRRAVDARAPGVVAEEGTAWPRTVVTLALLQSGRLLETTETWGTNGAPEKTTVRRYGKYGLQGDVVLVQFDTDAEERWRLSGGGRFLFRDQASYFFTIDWMVTELDDPK